jgi:hypothetical protein
VVERILTTVGGRTLMTHYILAIASFVVFAAFTARSYAAEPEFEAGLVTESRTYEREQLGNGGPKGACAALYCGAAVAQPVRVQIERVTVALEGKRLTAEWNPLMSRLPGMLARDFPLDTDVQAAIRGNELRLIHPDGGWVRARIVDRVNSEDEDERD